MRLYAADTPVTMKILALIGAAAVLLSATSGLVRLMGGGSLASFITAVSLSRERIAVRITPPGLTSGERVELTWSHEGKSADGSYELSYPCNHSFALALTGGAAIPCNAPFALGAASAVTLAASAAEAEPLTSDIAIAFRPNGADEPVAVGTARLSVVARPARQGTGAIAPRPTAPPPGSPAAIPPAGVPDLVIRIVQVGILNETTGELTATTSLRRTERAGLTFEVENAGRAASAAWRFRASLPTEGGDYTSPPQPGLAAGERVRFTLGFGMLVRPGENVLVITVDPRNELADANRANDSARAVLVRID